MRDASDEEITQAVVDKQNIYQLAAVQLLMACMLSGEVPFANQQRRLHAVKAISMPSDQSSAHGACQNIAKLLGSGAITILSLKQARLLMLAASSSDALQSDCEP